MTNKITAKPGQWRRFAARLCIDLIIFWILFFFLYPSYEVHRFLESNFATLAELNRRLFVLRSGDVFQFFDCLVIFPMYWIFVEALLLSTVGTTPGKYLLNIEVRTRNGNTLSFAQAAVRALNVWVIGLAAGLPFAGLLSMPLLICGLPILGFFTLSHQSKLYISTGYTTWDRLGQFEVKLSEDATKSGATIYQGAISTPGKRSLLMLYTLICLFLLFCVWLGLGWSGIFK